MLLADDHAVFREGLRTLLAREPDLVIVGEARDGREAVEMARALHPDVVVMDVAMPRLNGIEATRQIRHAAPATHVLILSAHDDPEYVDHALECGAFDYVPKRRSVSELAAAIRQAARARTESASAFAPVACHAPDPYESPCERPAPRETPSPRGGSAIPHGAHLTERQAEVLQLIAESRCNKEIARELGISVKTVEKHRQGLMKTLDVHDTAGLTRYAVASGTVECDGGHSPR